MVVLSYTAGCAASIMATSITGQRREGEGALSKPVPGKSGPRLIPTRAYGSGDRGWQDTYSFSQRLNTVGAVLEHEAR